MPRVPQFESQVREGRTQFGGGQVPAPNLDNRAEQQARRELGRAVKETTNLAVKIKEKEVEKATNMSVIRAQRQVMDIEDQLFHGKEGLMFKKGWTAMEDHKATMDEFNKGVDDIQKGLTPKARAKFEQSSLKYRHDAARRAGRHVAVEVRNAEIGERKAKIEMLRERAASAIGDVKVTKENIHNFTYELHDMAKTLDLPPESAKKFVKDEQGKLGGLLIVAALDTQDHVKAQEFFKQFKDDFSTEDRLKYGNVIKEIEKSSLANELTNDAIQNTDGESLEIRLSKIKDKVDKIKDDDIREVAQGNFKRFSTEQKRRQKVAIGAAIETGNNKILNILKTQGVVKNVETAVGSDVLSQIPKDKQAKALKAFRRFASRETETDATKMAKFKGLYKEDLLKMSKEDVFFNYTSHFSSKEAEGGGSDYSWAMKEWADAKRLQGKRHGKSMRDEVIDRLHKAGLISNKLKEGKTSKVDSALVKKVKPLIDNVLPTLRQENKTANELWNEALDSILIEAWRDDFFFDDKFLLGELTPEQIRSDDFYVEMKNIPADYIADIRHEFSLAKKTPTDRDIGRVFVAVKKKDWDLVKEIIAGRP